MNADGARELCAAIVTQAAKDYVTAKRRIGRGNTSEKFKWRLEETQNFFNGGWFETIFNYDISGNEMMRILDEKAKQKGRFMYD